MPKSGRFLARLISFKILGYHFLHFLAQVKGFEHLNAVAMREKRAHEIGCRAKVV